MFPISEKRKPHRFFVFFSFFTSLIRHQQMCLYVCIFPKALRRISCENYLFHSQSCCYLVTFQSTERKKEGERIESTTELLKLFQTSMVLQPLTEGRAQLCPWNSSTFLKKKKKS